MILHVPCRTLRADDHPEEIDVHDAGEVLEIVRQEPLERAPDTRIVEHDVEPAEALDREVDQGLHLVRITHIGLLERRRRTDLPGQIVTGVRVHVPDHDTRPLGHEQLGGRPANSARATGHDGHLPCEFPCVHTSTLRSRSERCRVRDRLILTEPSGPEDQREVGDSVWKGTLERSRP